MSFKTYNQLLFNINNCTYKFSMGSEKNLCEMLKMCALTNEYPTPYVLIQFQPEIPPYLSLHPTPPTIKTSSEPQCAIALSVISINIAKMVSWRL